jgi:carbonic anhydrase/acetyltransferase-like protein (isoleucine patch superfamily)
MIYQLDQYRVRCLGDYFIAESAVVVGRVVLHHNVSVWFGAVLRGDNEEITLGEYSNVQDLALLHTDMGSPLTVGRYCTIGHQAMLHGCTIGDNTLIGINAVVLNNAVIGPNCLIGAGSLITEGKHIPAGSLVMGAPGRVVRELSAAEIVGLRHSAQGYVENSQRYRGGLVAQSAPDTV